jgi:hypothetical protein
VTVTVSPSMASLTSSTTTTIPALIASSRACTPGSSSSTRASKLLALELQIERTAQGADSIDEGGAVNGLSGEEVTKAEDALALVSIAFSSLSGAVRMVAFGEVRHKAVDRRA